MRSNRLNKILVRLNEFQERKLSIGEVKLNIDL